MGFLRYSLRLVIANCALGARKIEFLHQIPVFRHEHDCVSDKKAPRAQPSLYCASLQEL
jgi:hypothetical protein